MKHTVKIHKKGKISEIEVENGLNLLRFLRKHSNHISAPCGGKGTCGKCKVRIEGLAEQAHGKEKKLLGDNLMSKGYRLACYNKITADLDIYLDGYEEKAKIVTESKERKTKVEPVISKVCLKLDSPNLRDQRTDIERVAQASGVKAGNTLELLRQLPDTLKKENYKVTCVFMDKKLIAVEPGDTSGINLGLAVDIGTTTVAAYLVDSLSGKRLGVYSTLNPQRRFGGDVISRINYTIEHDNGLQELHDAVVQCINEIILHFEKELNIKATDIYTLSAAGNTTMMHLLMKLPCAGLAVSPFIPVTTRFHKFKAKELNIGINPNGYVMILPSVSAYVGADTVGAVLASGMYSSDRITLLVDLGTNGEIVLGNSKWMYACSAAAGPAFEGANIRHGIGGIEGAIDKVEINQDLRYTTIGGRKAIGICGSGIVDAVSEMLTAGIIDETGRLLESDDVENTNEKLKSRLKKIDGQNSLLLGNPKGKKADCIAITQKDVRELQNAKAAIAAGIKILVKEAGISVDSIDRVYLAGGFGSYINVQSALNIGLLPYELKDRVETIGNAAGAGAVECLLSLKRLRKAEQIKEKINYIELSTKAEFMDEYVDCMDFERKDF